MNRFAPTTTSYGLLALPLEEAASAYAAYWRSSELCPIQSDLEGSAEDLFPHLEPLCMAYDKTLLVGHGDNWTSYFNNCLIGSDVFLVMSRLSGASRCTGLRVVRQPKATIFEAYECPEKGGAAPNNYRRSIYAMQDGRWTFGSDGEPYSFEDVSRYQAKRIRDRFTPDMLNDILQGLGAPIEPFPMHEKLNAKLFLFEGRAPQLPRWTYAEVQANIPWKRC